MSKIKKLLTENRGREKYFSRAVEQAMSDLWEIYDEIEGQTTYKNDPNFIGHLSAVNKGIRALGVSFDKLIDVIVKTK